MIELGQSIDDRYEIQQALGSGAFGEVYKAWHKLLERPVAVKVLNVSVLAEADGAARFEREGKAMHLLRHKNIVSFHGFGIWHGSPYMVMEFLEGTSLQATLRNQQALDPQRAVSVAIQLCEALCCAHANGIVHRDLKPSNLMFAQIDGKETLKIIDFGLAKLMPGYGIAAQKLTETGYAVGTCHYMSPEQCIGHAEVDHRTDLYAAGCLLFEMLTGSPPFAGLDNIAVMFQHVNAPIPRLSTTHRTSLKTEALQAVIDKSMAKDLADRYSDATEMLADLQAIQAGKFEHLAKSARTAKPHGTPLYHKPKWKKLVPFALIAAVLSGAAMGALLTLNNSRTTTDIEPPSAVVYQRIAIDIARMRNNDLNGEEVDRLLQQIDRVLALDWKDHSLTNDQRYQLLHEEAFALIGQNRPQDAISVSQQAIATPGGTDYLDDYLYLARAYENSGRLDDADRVLSDTYQRIVRGGGVNTYAKLVEVIRARVALKSGRFAEAEKLLKSVPTDNLATRVTIEYCKTYGNLNFLQKHYAKAQDDYEVGLQVTEPPESAIFQCGLARCALSLNNTAQYSKLRTELESVLRQKSLMGLRSAALLCITIAARQHNLEAAQSAADALLEHGMLPPDEIAPLNDWDNNQCRLALRQAGYNQIEESLAAKFYWAR